MGTHGKSCHGWPGKAFLCSATIHNRAHWIPIPTTPNKVITNMQMTTPNKAITNMQMRMKPQELAEWHKVSTE